LDSFRNVEKWLEEAKKFCPDQTPFFLVGTKSDLQTKRMVPYTAIKTFVESKGLTYIETSSKTNENVENCFVNFTRTLIEHTDQMEINHKIIPKPKVNIHDKTNPVKNKKEGCMGGNRCAK
jgi:GTPase SAR1 family protein